jgi:hypothetical protein
MNVRHTWRAEGDRIVDEHYTCADHQVDLVCPAEKEPMTTITKPGYVYVASSWRCQMQPAVIHTLRAAGIDAYDFRNPPNSAGFAWQEVMPGWSGDRIDPHVYLEALDHPRAVEGFEADFDAMKRADTFVLVLPCGNSAHLELGWAIGAGKRTAVLLDGPDVRPDLMYKMADLVTPSVFDLLGWLGVQD